MTGMRILITGSRGWTDEVAIIDALLTVTDGVYNNDSITVVHGGAAGADTLAGEAAARYLPGCTIEVHQPAWQADGRFDRGAGFKRNQKMVDLGADYCLAFKLNDSRGTAHCISRAAAAGIKVLVFTDGGS